jgi:hypothetical protein
MSHYLVAKWWLDWTCPDCGAAGGAECDESCPSALTVEIEAFEDDMEEWDHLTPEELAEARRRLAERDVA